MTVAFCGAIGFAGYVKFAPKAAHVADDLRRNQPEVTIDAKPEHSSSNGDSIDQTDAYLVPAVVNNEVKLSTPAGKVPEGIQPEVFVVNQTLASLGIDKARATGVDIHSGVAMMDFNPSLMKGYGTIEEGNLIKALQLALGQFKAIEKFQIIVEGKPIETLGNIDLTSPVDVIRPGATSGSTSPEASNQPSQD